MGSGRDLMGRRCGICPKLHGQVSETSTSQLGQFSNVRNHDHPSTITNHNAPVFFMSQFPKQHESNRNQTNQLNTQIKLVMTTTTATALPTRPTSRCWRRLHYEQKETWNFQCSSPRRPSMGMWSRNGRSNLQFQSSLCRTQWILSRSGWLSPRSQIGKVNYFLWFQHWPSPLSGTSRTYHGGIPNRKQGSWLAKFSGWRSQLGRCAMLEEWRSCQSLRDAFGSQFARSQGQSLLYQSGVRCWKASWRVIYYIQSVVELSFKAIQTSHTPNKTLLLPGLTVVGSNPGPS